MTSLLGEADLTTLCHAAEAMPRAPVTFRPSWQSATQPSSTSSDAIAMLHEATSGRLREIDRIAPDALKRAAKRKLKVVDLQLLQEVDSAT